MVTSGFGGRRRRATLRRAGAFVATAPGREGAERERAGVRFLVRMLGYLLVAGGFVTLLTDGARSIANSVLGFTPLGETLFALFGERYRLLQPAVERNLHPLLWDPVLLNAMLAPTALVGLGLGLLLLWLGAERKPAIGIVTRR